MPISTSDYHAPTWCDGGPLQTVIPAQVSSKPQVEYRREHVSPPVVDFMDWEWLQPEPLRAATPVLVHIFGLEGSSHSP